MLFRSVSLISVSARDLSRLTSFSERFEDAAFPLAGFLAADAFFLPEELAAGFLAAFFLPEPALAGDSVFGREDVFRFCWEAASAGIISSREASSMVSNLDTVYDWRLV